MVGSIMGRGTYQKTRDAIFRGCVIVSVNLVDSTGLFFSFRDLFRWLKHKQTLSFDLDVGLSERFSPAAFGRRSALKPRRAAWVSVIISAAVTAGWWYPAAQVAVPLFDMTDCLFRAENLFSRCRWSKRSRKKKKEARLLSPLPRRVLLMAFLFSLFFCICWSDCCADIGIAWLSEGETVKREGFNWLSQEAAVLQAVTQWPRLECSVWNPSVNHWLVKNGILSLRRQIVKQIKTNC